MTLTIEFFKTYIFSFIISGKFYTPIKQYKTPSVRINIIKHRRIPPRYKEARTQFLRLRKIRSPRKMDTPDSPRPRPNFYSRLYRAARLERLPFRSRHRRRGAESLMRRGRGGGPLRPQPAKGGGSQREAQKGDLDIIPLWTRARVCAFSFAFCRLLLRHAVAPECADFFPRDGRYVGYVGPFFSLYNEKKKKAEGDAYTLIDLRALCALGFIYAGKGGRAVARRVCIK